MPIGFYDKIIIADTSCFIAFDNIGSLGILQAICPAIITTPEVAGKQKSLRFRSFFNKKKTENADFLHPEPSKTGLLYLSIRNKRIRQFYR